MADEFGSGRASTSFFFAITTFLYFAIGVFSGRIADRIGPRRVLIVGAVCMVAGLLATSQVDRLWLGYLTYALGVGLGGILGLLCTGAGIGGLVGPPLMGQLIDGFGYSTTLIISGALGVTSFGVLLALRPQQPA